MDKSIYILIIVLGFSIGLAKLFQKAGEKSWKAFVPIYNTLIWLKIIKKPWWWILITFIPGVNIVIIAGMTVELLNAFGKRSTFDHIAGAIFGFIYLPLIGFDNKLKFLGPLDYKKEKKSQGREWSEAIFFAVIAATIIRTFTIEAFTIPTPSLERTLLAGDFLFVSKVNYGPRTPMTPLSVPFTHHTIPVLGMQSYLDWIDLPYFRLPGFEEVENNDMVVFNYPRDITLERPVDKRENYIKRCVGIPGDTIEIIEQKVHINGKLLDTVSSIQYSYYTNKVVSLEALEKIGLNNANVEYYKDRNTKKPVASILFLSIEKLKEGKKKKLFGDIKRLRNQPADKGMYPYFPHNRKKSKWNNDNLGPVYIPKKGESIELTEENFDMYQMTIRDYEGKSISKNDDGEVLINNKAVSSYTFEKDYYYMMGDNRHNSLDSRYWGFVPHDHIVGKPVFVWLSVNYDADLFDLPNKVRWDRVCSFVSPMGISESYKYYFFAGIVLIWFGSRQYRKRKAAKSED